MRTLTGTAASQCKNQYVRIVWLVEIDADGLDGSQTTLRYANRKYTLDGNTYQDAFKPGGISLGWQSVRPRGGLASVAAFTITLDNLENASDLQDTYVLDNDAVRVYLIFSTGAETASDRLLIASGVIEEGEWDQDTWRLSCIDTSDRDFTEIPTQKVNLIQHAYAPMSEYGKVLPYTLGTWTYSPVVAAATHIAATRCLDQYARTYTPGIFAAVSGGTLYEWLESDNCVARVVDKQGVDQHGDNATGSDIVAWNITSSDRVIVARPVRPGPNNTVAGYRTAVNEDVSETVSVASGELLELLWTGISTRGVLTSLQGRIYASGGDYTYDVKYDGVSVVTVTGASGLATIDLDAMIATYFSESWSFSQMSIEISADTATPVDVGFVFMNLSYAGEEGGDSIEVPRIFFYGTGTSSSTDIQNHVISGTSGTLAEEPVEQLALVLTGKDLYNRAEAEINTTSFAAAHTARDGSYLFSFQLMETVTWEYWNRFCFEAGLHLFLDWQGKWKVVARDKDAAAVHFFGPELMGLRDPGTVKSKPDVTPDKTATRDVINEIVLRYAWDPMTQQYLKMKVRSPQYRYTGTCTVDATAGTLTDAAGTFSTGKFPAFVGEKIYLEGNYTVTVTAINSDTELAVDPVEYDGLTDIAVAVTYYGGPSIDAQCVQSKLRYKTIGPLGGEYDPLSNEGGWPSDFIYDDDTADEFLAYVVDWFSQRRIVVEFSTRMNAVDVELGDVCYLRCPLLPPSRDAILLGALDGAISSGDLTITLSTASPYYGSLSFRQNDYIAIGSEVLQVTSEADSANEDHTVTRGEVNTTAAAHASGAKVYLLAQKWEVTGIKYDAPKSRIRLRLTEMPWVYSRVGIAMEDDLDYSLLTFEQRVATSWSLYPTGLLSEVDTHSNLSNSV